MTGARRVAAHASATEGRGGSEAEDAKAEGGSEEVTRDGVIAVLRANIHRRARVTFGDGVIQCVDIAMVDDEGFLHRGPDGDNPSGFLDTI
jgi:hypothetical protein